MNPFRLGRVAALAALVALPPTFAHAQTAEPVFPCTRNALFLQKVCSRLRETLLPVLWPLLG